MSNTCRLEGMDPEELAFLERRYTREQKAYMQGMRGFMLVVVVLPVFAGLWYYLRYRQTDVMYRAFGYTLVILLILFVLTAWLTYRRSLFDLHRDLREKTKIIESTHILEKKYMALNQTYHFFLDRAQKYTIEVSSEDFERFAVNDEINIEYARYSREYFGYH